MLQQHFGMPEKIVADRGSAFRSNDFKQFCDKEGIELHPTTTGVPRGNGQSERMNAIIEAVLAKLSHGEENKWYKYISRVQRAINGSYQRAIKTSPYELLFGTELKKLGRCRACTAD